MCLLSGLWMTSAVLLGWAALLLAFPDLFRETFRPAPAWVYRHDRQWLRWTLATLAGLACFAMGAPLVWAMATAGMPASVWAEMLGIVFLCWGLASDSPRPGEQRHALLPLTGKWLRYGMLLLGVALMAIGTRL